MVTLPFLTLIDFQLKIILVFPQFVLLYGSL